jgi:hypothetical protein
VTTDEFGEGGVGAVSGIAVEKRGVIVHGG